MDDGFPWDTGWAEPWTPLPVWPPDLGITATHPRPRHPQTAGKEERFHQALAREHLHRRPRRDACPHVQAAYDRGRVVCSQHRQHDALGGTVFPADRYQPSPRPYPERIEPPVGRPQRTSST
jgi:transposase InsO family protein